MIPLCWLVSERVGKRHGWASLPLSPLLRLGIAFRFVERRQADALGQLHQCFVGRRLCVRAASGSDDDCRNDNRHGQDDRSERGRPDNPAAESVREVLSSDAVHHHGALALALATSLLRLRSNSDKELVYWVSAWTEAQKNCPGGGWHLRGRATRRSQPGARMLPNSSAPSVPATTPSRGR